MSKFFHPKNIKRKRTHGFLARKNSPGGRRVIQKRRFKKRKHLTV